MSEESYLTFGHELPAAHDISFHGEGNKTYVTLHPDGTVTYGEGITPNEAAQQFWEAIAALLPMQTWAREAADRAYEDAAMMVQSGEWVRFGTTIPEAIRSRTSEGT